MTDSASLRQMMIDDPTIKEITISYGEPTIMWRLCGDDPFLGFKQCEKCKAIGPNESCGQYMVDHIVRSTEPPVITVTR